VNPDLVICADTVHTLAGAAPVQAVAISGGTIVATGSRDDVRDWRGARTEVVDLGDAVLTPGLTDGHMHPIMGLQLTADVDLSTARSLDEVHARLSAAAARRPEDAWVQAWGLDPNIFGGRPVTNAPIEAAVGGRPAFVRLFDAHSALATDRALAIAGVTGPRRFAQRSTVVCDDAGRPTGLLLEAAAMDLVQDHVPLDPVPVRAAQLRDLLQDMASTGLTGGHVMDLLGDSQAVVAAAEDLGELPVRLRFAPWCVPGADADGIAELVDLQRPPRTRSVTPPCATSSTRWRACRAPRVAPIASSTSRRCPPNWSAASSGRGSWRACSPRTAPTSPGPTTPTTGPRGSAASVPTVPGAAATSATPACRWSSGRTGRWRRSTLGTCSRTHSCAGQRASRTWPRCSRPRG
jgi:hypothetical protein